MLDLKDRLGPPGIGSGRQRHRSSRSKARARRSGRTSCVRPLAGLGYSGREVDDAIAAVSVQAAEGEQSVPVLLRSALTALRPA